LVATFGSTHLDHRDLKAARYPVDYGTYEELNDMGKKLSKLTVHNIYMRHRLDPEDADADWATYRDVDPSPFVSIFSGQQACKLPKPWLKLKPTDDLRAKNDR